MTTAQVTIAFDRSVRRKDEDGRLHISWTNISKAIVNPYYGREIPNAEALGLQPDRIYQLLRAPEELARAAPTFNNIQLLSTHKAVSARDPNEKLVAGSTGTDAEFRAPYLGNSLVIWRQEDIDDVESREKCELSCAYYYDADMVPGDYHGTHYDGVMRNIRGNHVALVSEGRAGPDVMVHDALNAAERGDIPDDQFAVPGKRKLPIENEKHVREAWSLLDDTDGLSAEEKAEAKRRILAAAKKHDIDTSGWRTGAAHDSKEITMAASKGARLDAVIARLKPFLAQDADMTKVRDAMDEADETEEERKAREAKEAAAKDADPDADPDDDDDDDAAKDKAAKDKAAKDKAAKDRKAARDAARAKDAFPDKEEDKAAKDKAMDAAIETRVMARLAAVTEAREAVRPLIGSVSIALDSAEAIYRLALDANKIDLKGVDPSAFKAMVSILPRQAAQRRPMAQDAATGNGIDAMFPALARITQA